MNEESRKEEVNRILPTISGGSWKRRAGIGDFGKGCSNLEDRDLARNHSETVNGQEGGGRKRDLWGIGNRRIGDFKFRSDGNVEIPSDTEIRFRR